MTTFWLSSLLGTLSLLSVFATATAMPLPVAAQVRSEVIAHAAATITATEVAHHLDALTAEALRGGVMPSRALELTAQYVAAEFQRIGLQPDGPSQQAQAAWLQRYPLPGQRRVDDESSRLALVTRVSYQGRAIIDESGQWVDRLAFLGFSASLYFAPEVGPQTIVPGKPIRMSSAFDPLSAGKPIVLVAGQWTEAALGRVADQIREKTVVYVPSARADSVLRRRILTELYTASRGVIVVSGDDSVRFATMQAVRQPVTIVDDYLRNRAAPGSDLWAVSVWAGALREFLASAGFDLAQLRADATPVLQPLPHRAAILLPAAGALAVDVATMPNVIGVLEGSDARLKHEYVVIAANMGGYVRPGRPDSLVGETNDNTSGVAGLLAIAEALSQPGARPRRSILFLATSGAGPGFWGASYFVNVRGRDQGVVANLTIRLADRAAGSSVWVDGLRDVELAATPTWIAQEHTELGLLVADGGTVVRPQSDGFAFAQALIPSLYIHTGGLGRLEGAMPDPAQIVHVSQFVFYVAQQIAMADHGPRWSTEGRERAIAISVP